MAEQILRSGMKEGETILVDFDSEKQQIVMNVLENAE
jgi:ATP-dependent Clp protease ATP-binding subunit ClpC